MTPRSLTPQQLPTLHVFEQDGGWQWGITIPRSAGGGFKVIAYSEIAFMRETEARCEGARVLNGLPNVLAESFMDRGSILAGH
jgi:hypothetical protein